LLPRGKNCSGSTEALLAVSGWIEFSVAPAVTPPYLGGKKISRLSWLPGKVMYHEIKQVIGARLYWCPARNGPKIKEMI